MSRKSIFVLAAAIFLVGHQTLGILSSMDKDIDENAKAKAPCATLRAGQNERCTSTSARPRICCGDGLTCSPGNVCVPLISVLFVGNSFTIRNDLPAMFLGLAKAGGHRNIIVDSSLIPSSTLGWHASYTEQTWNKLNKRSNWSFVVLQEQSQHLANGYSYYAQRVWPGASKLCAAIADKGATTVLFETWGYLYGDGFWRGDNYQRMQDRILTGYSTLERDLDEEYNLKTTSDAVRIAAVGEAWRAAYADLSFTGNEKSLYVIDGKHPSPLGSYLAACTLYASIFKESPVGLNYFPKGVSASAGRRMQAYAASAKAGDDSGQRRLRGEKELINH